MKTNAFDTRRFWQTLKWTVLTEKKSILTAFAAFLVAFLAIQLFSCFTIFDLTQELGSEATMAGMAVCLAVFSFMHSYYASGLLGNARTSRQRATALMLPASNLERYSVRFIYCCLIMPLLLLVAFFGATALRVLFEMLAGHDGIHWGFGLMKYHFGSNFDSWMSYAFIIWSLSLYVLGGVFFRARPFVWTSITIFAGSLLLTTLMFYIGTLIGEDNIKSFLMRFRDVTFEAFDLTVSLVFLAFTVFNVWLSYWLYCRLQVVQHKWFNL